MFETHDAAKQQSAGTADNTSAILSNFVMDSMKQTRPSVSSEMMTETQQGAPNQPGAQFLEFGPIPGTSAPNTFKPGEIPLSPVVHDQLEAELRLNDLTPRGNGEFEDLSRQLNHAFVTGDLTDFQRVLQSTDDPDMRSGMVSSLGERLDALEQGLPNETQMYSSGSKMEFFPEDEQRVYGFTMDLNTNETKTLYSNVMNVNVNGNVYPTMVPFLDENKQPVVVDTDAASLFLTLSQNEVRSIAAQQ